METIKGLLDFILHFDKHLDHAIVNYGEWTYGILGTIVFVETGFVVMPFLPGDSLLFAAGVFAGRGSLNLWVLYGVLITAALCGDNVNYWIGRTIGPKVFKSETSRLLNKKHLERTHAFLEKYGGKAIIMARFVPIVRTCMPFVAGVGAMTYRKFLAFSIFAAFFWVGVCVTAGYWFGGLPFVRNNFEIVVIIIVLISVIPAVIEFIKHKKQARRDTTTLPEAE